MKPSNFDNENENNVTATADEYKPGVVGPKHWAIRIGSFALLIATVAFVNLFGTKNSEISAKYYLYVTPPGLFFVIWALIFTLQIVANLVNLVKNVWTPQEHLLLAINNFLLILWTIVFDIGNDPAVFSAFFVLLAIIPVGLVLWRKVGQIRPITWFTYFTRNAYAFYLGWIVAATNLNFGMIIVYGWKGSQEAQLIVFWVLAPLCALAITAVNVYNEKLYGLKSCFALWCSVIWAFVGASITSNRCLNEGCVGPA